MTSPNDAIASCFDGKPSSRMTSPKDVMTSGRPHSELHHQDVNTSEGGVIPCQKDGMACKNDDYDIARGWIAIDCQFS